MAETLVAVLADPTRRRAVVADSVKLVESEVASKSGLRGAAIKAGFSALKRVKPGIVPAAVDKLLPDFAPVVDPFYSRARESGDTRGFFTARAESIADALLGVTDAKAEGAKNPTMKKIYMGLRGQALKHTAAAMPGLADLIDKHVEA